MKNPVIIFGAGTIGRAAKEIFDNNEVVVYGFLDDTKSLHGNEIDTVTVLGSTDDDGFLKLIGKKCEAFVAIDENRLRRNLVKMLHEKRKIQPVNAIHRSALVPDSVHLGHGNLLDMGIKIGAGAKIGNHNLIHAGAIIGPESAIGDFVQIGMGSMINAGVKIEDEAFIGSGVTIVSGVTIGKGARVGAGAVVIASVSDGETVFGNPAQVIKG